MRPRLGARRLAAAVGLVGLSAFLTAGNWIQGAVVASLKPKVPFRVEDVPPAPDYGSDAAWTALPWMQDEADAALPDDPGIDQKTADIDVFYVHPTTYVGRDWNGPVGDPKLDATTDRVATRIQASAFNASGAIWGPRYRQATMNAFFSPDDDGDRAFAIALSDVERAFDAFEARRGPGRPFLLAGHSQGAMLAVRLLEERIANSPARDELIAAWLPGAPFTVETLARAGFTVCTTPEQTGCVMGWNARAPGYVPGRFDIPERGGAGGTRVCVNPITWTVEGSAPASANAGAVFLDADPPRRIAAFAGAECVDGTLVAANAKKAPRDWISRVLDDAIGQGNYHPIEFQMYFTDIRRNAAARARAWRAAHRG